MSPSTLVSKCLPRDTESMTVRPTRFVVAYLGTRKSLRIRTCPTSASRSWRAVRQTTSPSGMAPLCHRLHPHQGCQATASHEPAQVQQVEHTALHLQLSRQPRPHKAARVLGYRNDNIAVGGKPHLCGRRPILSQPDRLGSVGAEPGKKSQIQI